MVIKTEELVVNFGPQHPAMHGVLRLLVTVSGEIILTVKPDIGFLHRCQEKIAEARTYEQVIPFTDRWDYLNSMGNNLAYCLAVEKLAQIEVPKRAQYIRVLMAELNRIASHLLFYGALGLDLGAFTVFLYCFREREWILDLYEMVCGARLTYNYLRIGGVAADLPEKFLEKTKEFCAYFKPKIDEYENLFQKNYIFKKRMVGVGILPKEVALGYGTSGPVLRGSGIKHDLRKDEPYLVYPELDFDLAVGKNGDSWERTLLRLEEMRQSVQIIEQVIEKIPEGEYITPGLPRLIVPPAGAEAYVHVESPRGELGVYLVSDGSPRPYRMKMRSPAFSNLSVLPEIATGNLIADLIAILSTLDPVFGEVDR